MTAASWDKRPRAVSMTTEGLTVCRPVGTPSLSAYSCGTFPMRYGEHDAGLL
jgi:hypothetical protein